MSEQRLIDVDELKEKEQYIPCGNGLLFHGVTAATVDAMPTIDPETLPIVRELRAQVKDLQEQLFHLEYWGLDRKLVLESAAQDRAAVNVMRKRCEKTIADLRTELKRVTEERDALLKELTGDCSSCFNQEFCLNNQAKVCNGDNWKWRGPVAENATTESGVKNDESSVL